MTSTKFEISEECDRAELVSSFTATSSSARTAKPTKIIIITKIVIQARTNNFPTPSQIGYIDDITIVDETSTNQM